MYLASQDGRFRSPSDVATRQYNARSLQISANPVKIGFGNGDMKRLE